MQNRYISLDATFEKQVNLTPGKIAIIEGELELSFASFFVMIEHLQTQLSDLVCAPLEKVAIVDTRGMSFVAMCYAALKSGMIIVALDPYASTDEWETYIRSCDVTLLVVAEQFKAKAELVVARCEHVRSLSSLNQTDRGCNLYEILSRAHQCIVGTSCTGDAFIACTSGTTGKPKGVILTHSNLLSNQEAVARCLNLSSHEVLLVLKPLFLAATIMEMMMILHKGGCLVFSQRYHIRLLPHWIEQYCCTLLSMVPTMVYDIVTELVTTEQFVNGKRKLTIAAGQLKAELFMALEQTMPETEIFYGYGLTEASPRVSTLLPSEWKTHMGSSGRAIPNVQIAVWSKPDEEVAPGVVGEIVVYGPGIMRGYYKNNEATSTTLRHGWLRTKDIGWIDEAGYLYLIGRADEIINSGGNKIAPQEVEHILSQHSAIHDAAVCATPHDRLGFVPVAFVVANENVQQNKTTANEIIHFCRQHLAPYKIPRSIFWIEALPYTASGKVRRLELAKHINRYVDQSK